MIESLSANVSPDKLLESQMAALWNLLARHIYGKSDKSENQLKQLFEKHGEFEVLEKKVYKEFSQGKKLQLNKSF